MRPVLFTLLLLGLCTPLHAEPLSKSEYRQAQRLFVALGCRACHDFEKSGSTLAGSLDRIGLKLNEEEILRRLQLAPEERDEANKYMPSYQTTPADQLKLLSRFLAARK